MLLLLSLLLSLLSLSLLLLSLLLLSLLLLSLVMLMVQMASLSWWKCFIPFNGSKPMSGFKQRLPYLYVEIFCLFF
jgi:hypothetical protein